MKVPERDFLPVDREFAPTTNQKTDLSFLPNPLPQSLPFSYRESILTFLRKHSSRILERFFLFTLKENSHPAPKGRLSTIWLQKHGYYHSPTSKKKLSSHQGLFPAISSKVKKRLSLIVYIRVYVKNHHHNQTAFAFTNLWSSSDHLWTLSLLLPLTLPLRPS